jgi:lipopolysaccharide export system permease protein
MEMMSNKNIPADELNMKFSMIMQLEGLYKDSQRVLTQFNVEIHKRIANPVSCQIFFFLSFPLGLVVKRSGKGMSFSLAIIFLFLYYAIFIFGSGISLKSNVPDWIGPWMANLTMGMISIYIMISRTDIQIKKTFPFNYINLAWKRLAIYTSKIKFYKKK